MRALLISVLALVLASCGKSDQAANNDNIADSLTADSIVANDVTAIDAVTGDAANMAADVDMNFGNLEPRGQDSTSNESSSKPNRPAPRKPETAPDEPSNAVANATANSE
jgi:hypothetical protein